MAAVFNRNAIGMLCTIRDLPYTQDTAATFSRTADGVRGPLRPIPRYADSQPFRAQLLLRRLNR